MSGEKAFILSHRQDARPAYVWLFAPSPSVSTRKATGIVSPNHTFLFFKHIQVAVELKSKPCAYRSIARRLRLYFLRTIGMN
jgi:hypothetical protein